MGDGKAREKGPGEGEKRCQEPIIAREKVPGQRKVARNQLFTFG
jgi:hypothetical protein